MRRPNHGEEFIVSIEYSREDIWTEVLNKDLSEIDLEPFQPEEYGFVIVRVIKGQLLLLNFNITSQ